LAEVAGASQGTSLAKRSRARRKEIRSKQLIFVDFRLWKTGVTGAVRRLGSGFRHRQGSQRKDLSRMFMIVLVKDLPAEGGAPGAA
jgi:hypothetical protein